MAAIASSRQGWLNGTTSGWNARSLFAMTDGTLYAVVLDTSTTKIRVHKGIGNGTWTEQDSADAPTHSGATHSYSAWMNAAQTFIYVVYRTATNTIRVRRFNLSTNQWETTDHGGAITASPHSDFNVRIVTRSDGDILIFYRDTTSSDVYYTRYEGTSFTTGAVFSGTGTETVLDAVITDSDRTHVFYYDTAANDLFTRAIDSSNTLGTETTIDATCTIQFGGCAGYYTDGTEYVGFLNRDSTGDGDFYYFTSANAPTITNVNAVVPTSTTDIGIMGANVVTFDNKWQLIWSGDARGQIHRDVSDSIVGPVFGTDTTPVTGLAANDPSLCAMDTQWGVGVLYTVHTATPTVDFFWATGGVPNVTKSVGATISISSNTHDVVTGDWRFYSDATPDGSMTALAAVNTVPTLTGAQMQNGIVRLRAQLVEQGGVAGSGAITLHYSADGGTTWNVVQEQSPTSGQEGWWFRWANGAATASATIGSQLLTGSTESGKYHEAGGVTASVGSLATHELDLALLVHWPPPDTNVLFRISYAGTALVLGSGETRPQVTTSTAANRPHTITRLDADTIQKTTREMRFSAWERFYYAHSKWWFFTVQVGTPTVIRPFYWTGSGAWTASTTRTSARSGHQSRQAFAFKNISGTEVVHSIHTDSTSSVFGARGVLNSDGSITWGSEWSVTQATDRHRHIAIDDGNFVWIAGTTAATGLWVRRSTNADDTSAWNAAITIADNGVASGDVVAIQPIGSDSVLVMWRSGTVLKWSKVSAGSASAAANINATTNAGPEDWGFVRKGSFVYLVHSDATGAGGNWVLRVYSISGNSWSTGTAPSVSGQPTSNDGIALTVDPSLNEIYAFATFANTEGGQDRKVQYKKYTWSNGSETSGTWGSLVDVTPSANRGNGDHVSAPRTFGGGSIVMGFAFNDDDAVAHPRTAEYHVVTLATQVTRAVGTSVAVTTTNTRTVAATAAIQTLGNTRTVASTVAVTQTNTRSLAATAAVSTTLSRVLTSTVATSVSEISRAVASTVSVTTVNTRSLAITAALLTTETRSVSSTVSLEITTSSSRSVGATAAIQETYTRSCNASVAIQQTNTRQVVSTAAISTLLTRSLASMAAVQSVEIRSVAATVAIQSIESRTLAVTAAVSTEHIRAVGPFVVVTQSNERTVVSTVSVSQPNARSVNATVSITQTNERAVVSTVAISGGTSRSVAATVAIIETLTRSLATTTSVQETFSRSLSATASVMIPLARTLSATVAVQTQETRTVGSTVAIQDQSTRSLAASAAVQVSLVRSLSATLVMFTTNTQVVGVTAAILEAEARAVGTTVSLVTAPTRPIAVSAAIRATETRAVASTVAVQQTNERAVSTTASVLLTFERTVASSVSVQVSFARAVSATVTLTGNLVRTVGATIALQLPNTRTLSQTVSIQETLVQQVPTSAAVLTINTRQITASAAILETQTRVVSASIAVEQTNTRAFSTFVAITQQQSRSLTPTAAILFTHQRFVGATLSATQSNVRSLSVTTIVTVEGVRTLGTTLSMSIVSQDISADYPITQIATRKLFDSVVTPQLAPQVRISKTFAQ